jgi:sigma-B regulation protein RsbU (phosphoserine phosphatase)
VLMGVFNPRENRHRWVNISSVPLFRSGDNEPWQVYSTFEDVTELMTLRRTLEQQLSVLRKALIPAVSREIEGYTLAADYRPVFVSQVIGGDFYDVFPVEDGRVGILIGDVAGKGIEAASLATATRSTVRAYAYEMRNTSDAMGHANSVLCAQQQSDWGTFVTVFLLILDPLSGSIDYCSAGHPPAILYRHSGVTELLEAANPPIGLWDKHKFNNATNKIDSGDRIILYTDGITESRHRSQLFGEEGIQRVLLEHGGKNLNDLMQEIVAASIDWSEGSLADDAALILLERKQASSDYRAETAPSTAQHPITPHL